MNTLRIPPLALKRLIALLLLAPAMAGAQQTFYVTNGSSFTVTSADTSTFEFSVGGNGFSADILFTFGLGAANPLPYPISSFPNGLLAIGADTLPNGENLTMSLIVNGVPWTIFDGLPVGPQRGVAFAGLNASGFPNSPGTFSLPFSFSANYFGAPATESAPDGCDTPNACQQLLFKGSGAGLFTLGPSQVDSNQLGINKATFTFKAPEPSTTALLLIGLAGIAVLACRRASRMTAVQCG
jgi:hypothetical protein